MRSPLRLTGCLAIAATAAALLTACGGSSNDKPAYCTDRSNLQSSVSDLKSGDVVSGGLGAIQSQLAKVDSDAKALVASAKGDFPEQTAAISSSLTSLNASVKSLASAPSAAGAVSVGRDVAATVNAAKAFSDATADKC